MPFFEPYYSALSLSFHEVIMVYPGIISKLHLRLVLMNILFGISDTQECYNAIKFAVKLAHSLKEVRFTLLHVSMEVFIYSESGMMDYGQTEALEEEKAKALLKQFEDAFKKENIECESVLKSGDLIDVVLDMAKDYDLLLIGASESNLLYRLFISHQNSLVEQSSIPVVIAK